MADIINIDVESAQKERDERNEKIGYYCTVLDRAIPAIIEHLIATPTCEEKSAVCAGKLCDGKILTVTVEVKNG